jgi:hypothetical protein
MPMAIGLALLTAIGSLGVWAAIGGASAPPQTTTSERATTTASSPITTDDTIPRGIAPEEVPVTPLPRETTPRTHPSRASHASEVSTATQPTVTPTIGPATTTTPPTTPVEATSGTAITPTTVEPEPTTGATIEPLPSSPGQRPASRLRIQYLGSSGVDQAAVSSSVDPRIHQCIAAPRHYANRTVVAFRVTIEADARVSEARATSDDGTEAERACVAEALRSAPWPSTGARRQTYVRVTALL